MEILKKSSFKFFLFPIVVLVLTFCYLKYIWPDISNTAEDILNNIAFLSASLATASFFTLFVKPEVFTSWLHFMYWWIVPLLFAYSLSSSRGGGFSGINPWEPLFPILLGLFVFSTPIYLFLKSKKLK